MKAWVTGRLKAINNVMGIRMAQFLAEIIESGDASTVQFDGWRKLSSEDIISI
jgi:hypothetical protein